MQEILLTMAKPSLPPATDAIARSIDTYIYGVGIVAVLDIDAQIFTDLK